METLRRGVSDRHDGCARRTVEGMSVRHRCSSEDTWKKIWRPLGEGSLTIEEVMQDEPSQVRRSVVGVRQRTLEKNMETLRRGVSNRHNGYAGQTTEGMTIRRCCPFEDP